jgi:hypothetical protein
MIGRDCGQMNLEAMRIEMEGELRGDPFGSATAQMRNK